MGWQPFPAQLKVSSTGRHFVDRNDKPFFWLGDTAWPLLVQYSKSQVEAYLKTRSAQGFTVIQSVVAWGQGSGMEKNTPLPNPDGHGVWNNNDPATPNDGFFKHVDSLVAFADQHGLVMALWPTWGYYVTESNPRPSIWPTLGVLSSEFGVLSSAISQRRLSDSPFFGELYRNPAALDERALASGSLARLGPRGFDTTRHKTASHSTAAD